MKALSRIFDEHEIRAVVIKGEPWFVAQDVADALGFDRARNAYRMLDDEEKGAHILSTPGGAQEVVIISESGLYSMILKSTRPEAKRFKKWITAEVLPSIRKTGRYAISKEERLESSAARSTLTRQWQEHGADKFYHYVNLTRAEYQGLFGTAKKKKEDMTAMEIAALRAFEGLEAFKLMQSRGVQGYHALAESVQATARALPAMVSAIPARLES